MHLNTWIEKVGPKAVAARLGVDDSTVSNWKVGKAFPRPQILVAINKMSRGKVTIPGMVHYYLKLNK